jgi:hypothetical protein
MTGTAPVVFYAVTAALDYRQLLAKWRSQLTADDMARLRRLRFNRDRRDYLAAHVLLREGNLRFRYRMSWSLTHATGFAACAFARRGTPIGVDAEPVASSSRLAGMPEVFVSERERRWLDAAPLLRPQRLVELWTTKEAMLKSLGVGIAASGGFDVLRVFECVPAEPVDGWGTIAVRDARSDARATSFVRRVGEHVLAVVSDPRSDAPRIEEVVLS